MKKNIGIIIHLFLIGFFLILFGGKVMALTLKSSAFKNGEIMPVKYTGVANDISPDLSWDDIPDQTQSFALICDDPDAPGGDWVHWVIYDIPAQRHTFKEGVFVTPKLDYGIKQGVNDFGNIGYDGPMPPPGQMHRYFFKLYALDRMLNLAPGLSKEQLLKELETQILEKAQLMVKFKR